MYITFFAGSPWAKTVFFPRNCSTFLPRPAESRNNFTLKAGLLVFAFLGERRTLADTRRGADDSMAKNSMEPEPADCSILHSPSRPALSACPSEKGSAWGRTRKTIVIYKGFHKETAILDLHYPGSVGAIAFGES